VHSLCRLGTSQWQTFFLGIATPMFGWPCYQIGSIASRQKSESTHTNPTGVRPSALRVRELCILLSSLWYYIDSDKLWMLGSCSFGYFSNCKMKYINLCCNYSSVRLACSHTKSRGWSRHSVITVLIPASQLCQKGNGCIYNLRIFNTRTFHPTYLCKLNFTILWDQRLISKMYWPMAYHMLIFVCLLGSNLNVPAKPGKLRPSWNTFGICICLQKVKQTICRHYCIGPTI